MLGYIGSILGFNEGVHPSLRVPVEDLSRAQNVVPTQNPMSTLDVGRVSMILIVDHITPKHHPLFRRLP